MNPRPPLRDRLPTPARGRLLRWLPLATVLCGVSLAAVLTFSCGPGKQPAPSAGPEVPPGTPEIRVRLGSTVSTAEIWVPGAVLVRCDGATVLRNREGLQRRTLRRRDGRWLLGRQTIAGEVLVVRGEAPALFGATIDEGPSTTYRGWLRALPAGPQSFQLVNHVDIESYLAGVLPKELYPGWSLATYKAQAVAARTFALYHKATFGPTHEYDLGGDTAWQVYGGFSAETEKARLAVNATYGQVLAHGEDGQEKIFLAQYSATNGGWVNPAAVLRNAPRIEPLAGGQQDPDGEDCPRYRWATVSIDKSDLHRSLLRSYPSAAARLRAVERVEVVEETDFGRPLWVRIHGPEGGEMKIRAEDLRLSLLGVSGEVKAAGKLYSMNCRIVDAGEAIEFRDGRGWGHGVGLSQWGAQAKAARGWDARRILAFYYPGAVIVRAY
jgi:stage II sporulation protein D